MMGVTGGALTNQAGLRCNKGKVCLVSLADGLWKGHDLIRGRQLAIRIRRAAFSGILRILKSLMDATIQAIDFQLICAFQSASIIGFQTVLRSHLTMRPKRQFLLVFAEGDFGEQLIAQTS